MGKGISHRVWEYPIAKCPQCGSYYQHVRNEVDMWVMGINLTNQLGLWWVPWFPYNGDQWWSRNSPSVPTESSILPMPHSSGVFASTSSSMGSFVWRESSHNRHRFVGARHDLSRPYPSSEDVYLRSNQYVC